MKFIGQIILLSFTGGEGLTESLIGKTYKFRVRWSEVRVRCLDYRYLSVYRTGKTYEVTRDK